MKNSTITREDIAHSMAAQLNLTKKHAHKILNNILCFIKQNLAKDGSLKFSSFGSFYLLEKRERIGRNPKTRKEVMIAPRKSISFRSSDILKNEIIKGQ